MVMLGMIPVVCLIAICLWKLAEAVQIRREAQRSSSEYFSLDRLVEALRVCSVKTGQKPCSEVCFTRDNASRVQTVVTLA